MSTLQTGCAFSVLRLSMCKHVCAHVADDVRGRQAPGPCERPHRQQLAPVQEGARARVQSRKHQVRFELTQLMLWFTGAFPMAQQLQPQHQSATADKTSMCDAPLHVSTCGTIRCRAGFKHTVAACAELVSVLERQAPDESVDIDEVRLYGLPLNMRPHLHKNPACCCTS